MIEKLFEEIKKQLEPEDVHVLIAMLEDLVDAHAIDVIMEIPDHLLSSHVMPNLSLDRILWRTDKYLDEIETLNLIKELTDRLKDSIYNLRRATE